MKTPKKKSTDSSACVINISGTKTEMDAIFKAAKKLKVTPEGFLLYLADNFIHSK